MKRIVVFALVLTMIISIAVAVNPNPELVGLYVEEV